MTTFDDIDLHRASTAEQVASGLMGKIMRGEIRSGDPLRESAIATALGVSRNSVREAVRLLERSSLVTYEFNRGAVVRDPTTADVMELYRARGVLEVAAAGTRDPCAHHVEALERAFDELVAAAEAGEPRAIVSKDLAFHSAIVEMLESSRISDYFAQLVRELEFYLMVLSIGEKEYARPSLIIDEHRVILDAIKASKVELATATVAEHIQSNASRVEEVLRSRSA